MIYIIVILAFVLAWFFIEITLFIVNKKYNNPHDTKKISYNKFIWNLRILAILLIFFTTIYMYFFENAKFLQAINYCLGVLK